MKIRAEISKGDEIRYISHLDYSRAIERALRRAQLPLAYSEGFNPHVKLSFASALAVGITSQSEFMDLELTKTMNIDTIKSCLEPQLPAGINLIRCQQIYNNAAKLMAVVNLACYKVFFSELSGHEQLEKSIHKFNFSDNLLFVRENPKGKKQIDVKEYVQEICCNFYPYGLELSFDTKITPSGSIKPGEVLQALDHHYDLNLPLDDALICRTGLFIEKGTKRMSPFDLIGEK